MAVTVITTFAFVVLAVLIWATTQPSAADSGVRAGIDSRRPDTRVGGARCPDDRAGVVFYRQRYVDHREARGVETPWPPGRKPRSCADADYLADIWPDRAHAERIRTEQWMDEHYLHDYEVADGNHAWQRAVREVQRAYPGTEAWLLSCSASEGGWGRWVPNSQGSGVGGWLQFMPGTWAGFFRHAVEDVRARGFRVPDSAASWYSTLGQALAGAWGITHGMRRHWAGGGCWQ